MGRLRDIRDFLRVRKKWWLIPIIAVLVFLSMVLVIAHGSVLAPLIYAIF
jgi:hypothetical protein